MDAGAETAWWPASPAAELLHDRRAVIPVIGAGLSAAAGMPSSADLATLLAARLPGDTAAEERDDLFAVADAASHAYPRARHEIQQEIAAAIAAAPMQLTDAHRALVTVRSRVLVTFTYDEVLEEAAQEARIPWVACTYRETEKLVEQLRTRERHRLLIYHAHGSVAYPSSIVVDDVGYRELSNDRAISRVFEHLADLNTLCFLGTRLDEPYLQTTLLRLPFSHPRHVLIGDDETLDEIAQPSRRGALLPWRYGIVTCSLGKDWSVLPGFCRRLAGRTTPRTIEIPAAAPPPSSFVEPVIQRATTPTAAEIATLMHLAFPSDEVLAQSDVVRAWRALITAPAGSGKSTVLRHIAAHQPETECPVVIELPRLLQLRGSPDALLERWVTQGEGIGAPRSTSTRACSCCWTASTRLMPPAKRRRQRPSSRWPRRFHSTGCSSHRGACPRSKRCCERASPISSSGRAGSRRSDSSGLAGRRPDGFVSACRRSTSSVP
jgi:hypothetical protein